MTQFELSKRTPEETFGHHAQTLMAEDLEGILVDYTDTSIVVSPSGVLHGKNAIRGFFADLLRGSSSSEVGRQDNLRRGYPLPRMDCRFQIG